MPNTPRPVAQSLNRLIALFLALSLSLSLDLSLSLSLSLYLSLSISLSLSLSLYLYLSLSLYLYLSLYIYIYIWITGIPVCGNRREERTWPRGTRVDRRTITALVLALSKLTAWKNIIRVLLTYEGSAHNTPIHTNGN